MKMALDYWYELWENSGSEGNLSLERRHSEEEGHYCTGEKDYQAQTRDKETGGDSR
jgi:hypothetical protein